MKKKRQRIHQPLFPKIQPQEDTQEQETVSIWSRAISLIKENGRTLFVIFLTITGGIFMFRRNQEATQPSIYPGLLNAHNEFDSMLQRFQAIQPNSYLEVDGPAECDGLLLYHANPQNRSLNSYSIILAGSEHGSDGETKVTECVDALSGEGDSVLTEHEEQGKSIECSELGLTKKD